MTLPDGISDESRIAIKQSAIRLPKEVRNDSKFRDPYDKIDSEVCNIIRSLSSIGVTQRDIGICLDISSSATISRHVNGRCNHGVEESKELPQEVTYTECGWMRRKAQNGVPLGVLSDMYSYTTIMIEKHVIGNCDHNHDCSTVSRSDIERGVK